MKGLLTSLLTVLTFTGLQAQTNSSAPRLVVGLVIDQLRTDYLEAFSSLYGEKGFKRLWKEGGVFTDVQFPFCNVDRSSAIAAIYTGTTPSLNGIVGSEWVDASTYEKVDCVEDQAYMAYYGDKPSSPAKLLTSTIADELKIATQGRGIVLSIAPFRDAAILAAGHAANAALWINPSSGKWSGTTYYGEFPWWTASYNDSLSIDLRISEIVWEPLLPKEKYAFLPEWRSEAFRYEFDDKSLDKYQRFVTTPLVNGEINALAAQALDKELLGKDEVTDFLSLTYYAGNYSHRSVQECAMEIQDAYVRLDKYVGELLDLLEQKVGLHNVLLCITSSGYTDSEAVDSGLYKIPSGEFYLNRCAALLNMYLMATYGEGKYVKAYHDLQIYLNRELLEQKGLNLAEIQEKSAEFLVQFSGVRDAYSGYRLMLGAWNPEIEKMRNGFHRQRSGDLFVEVLPGWSIMNEENHVNKVIRYSYIPSPLFLMGFSVKPMVVRTPVTIEHLVPSLANFMRIRAPNACKVPPFAELQKNRIKE